MSRGRSAARRAAWLLTWAAVTLAALLALRATPWRAVAAQVAHQRVGFALLAVLLNLAILPLWALEWRRLAPIRERPTFRRLAEVVAVTSATLNTVPFFAGEASAVVLLIARGGLTRAGALSVLALDQLLVGVAKLVVIAAAAALAPLPAGLRGGARVLAVTVAAALLVLVAAAWALGRAGAAASARIPAGGLLAFARDWAARLEVLRDARAAAWVLMLALLKKGAEVLAVVAAHHALGVALPWWSAVLVVAALGIGTLLPLAPANLGTYEASAFVVYRYLGLPVETALGLAIVQHLYFLIPAIGAGWALLLARQFAPSAPTRASKAAPAPETPATSIAAS
ncbi:MAG TPA: lysylphosphatidylglycerol synthase transmembrane domain-containing protein [Gemmatimonadaceae bacterium]|nr:lysylphosphatidylglycerol synthase transmembrane domain-containing protein [Gemmatimonadaceae bacterium]